MSQFKSGQLIFFTPSLQQRSPQGDFLIVGVLNLQTMLSLTPASFRMHPAKIQYVWRKMIKWTCLVLFYYYPVLKVLFTTSLNEPVTPTFIQELGSIPSPCLTFTHSQSDGCIGDSVLSQAYFAMQTGRTGLPMGNYLSGRRPLLPTEPQLSR